jgi:hypothetical protein
MKRAGRPANLGPVRRGARALPRGLVALPVSAGEILDRLTILEIKLARSGSPGEHQRTEAALGRARQAWARGPVAPGSPDLASLARRLRATNKALWEAEDRIRGYERRRQWGDAFVAVARAICRLNDRRSSLKQAVDALAGLPPDGKIYARGAHTNDVRDAGRNGQTSVRSTRKLRPTASLTAVSEMRPSRSTSSTSLP